MQINLPTSGWASLLYKQRIPKWSFIISEHAHTNAQQNHYEVLGVPKNATANDIKKAYLSLCKKYHPDANMNLNERERQSKSEQFKRITHAHQCLSNESARRDYDRNLNAQSNSSSYRNPYTNRPHMYQNPYRRQTYENPFDFKWMNEEEMRRRAEFIRRHQERMEREFENEFFKSSYHYRNPNVQRISNWKLLFLLIVFTIFSDTGMFLFRKNVAENQEELQRQKYLENQAKYEAMIKKKREEFIKQATKQSEFEVDD